MAEQQYEQNIRKDLILAKESSLVVELFYKGGLRLVDPINIYVDKEGVELVLTWQVDGFSPKGGLPAWRTFYLGDIADVKVLRTTFQPPVDHKEKLESLQPVRVIA